MGLYHHSQARENCGFGLIAHLEGTASHRIVRTAISGLDRMQHRGGISADGKTGDGCGLLMQKPDSFFRAIAEENGWPVQRFGSRGTPSWVDYTRTIYATGSLVGAFAAGLPIWALTRSQREAAIKKRRRKPSRALRWGRT